ncbi:MAG: ATP-binding protein [Proteobacteria bacterium]|nr:ATP-binding protein [Pseudomonadota bacterium]
MYITRLISEKIQKLATQYPAIVLAGARQVGKTTLLKELFPQHNFVSLDLPSLAEQAENDPDLFLTQHPFPLIVDEVQYAPKLFRHLKSRIDLQRHKMGQVILTGSQKFILMKEVSDSLAGRAAILNLENLSSQELKLGATDDWTKILVRGFYPELWRQPDLNPSTFYSSYLSSYLERDVRQILNVQSIRDFERFIRACAARSAQLLNMSDLARDVGIKPQTARDWLSVLEASNQVTLLEPYFENVGKRIVKSPKLYVNDPGMLCYLMALDQQALMSTPIIGAIWETFVFAEFRKYLATISDVASLWYYRDSQAREIDFLLLRQGKIQLFECKWTESPDERWVSNLNEVSKILSSSPTYSVGASHLLCRIPHRVTRSEVTCFHASGLATMLTGKGT